MPTLEEDKLGFFVSPAKVCDEDLNFETFYLSQSKTIVYPTEISTQDQMNAIEASGTLDFWNDPAEDIYSEKPDDAG